MKPYYEYAGITIYHGDCFSMFAEIASICSVDHIITDPPYSERTHKGHDSSASGHIGAGKDRANRRKFWSSHDPYPHSKRPAVRNAQM